MFPWIKDVTDEEKRQADAIREELLQLGASPDGISVLEAVHFGYAPVARYLLANHLWEVVDDAWGREPRDWWGWVDRDPDRPHPDSSAARAAHSLRRMLHVGADPDDVKRVVRKIIFDVLVDVMGVLEQERDPEAEEDLPGWRVMEVDANRELTGRIVAGLPQELLDTMPDDWFGDEDGDAAA
ncbi:MAG TPA: hypothetical protein VGX50_06395 [Longimicrobium sp.]|jgi:hypothetical protein|nr:hypothetical protein [Longimicrobium sp.]